MSFRRRETKRSKGGRRRSAPIYSFSLTHTSSVQCSLLGPNLFNSSVDVGQGRKCKTIQLQQGNKVAVTADAWETAAFSDWHRNKFPLKMQWLLAAEPIDREK